MAIPFPDFLPLSHFESVHPEEKEAKEEEENGHNDRIMVSIFSRGVGV